MRYLLTTLTLFFLTLSFAHSDVSLYLGTGSILQGAKTFDPDESSFTLNLAGTGPTVDESAKFSEFDHLKVDSGDELKFSNGMALAFPTVTVKGTLCFANETTLIATTGSVADGATLIVAGTIGRLDVDGTLAPGILFLDDLNLGETSVLEIEFDATSIDFLDVSGTIMIDPDATIRLIPSESMFLSETDSLTHTFINADLILGAFNNVELDPGFTREIIYSYNSVILNIRKRP